MLAAILFLLPVQSVLATHLLLTPMESYRLPTTTS